MDLKSILKTIRMNESTISTILGVLVVIVVGILIINYFRNRASEPTPSVSVPGEQAQVTPIPAQFTGNLPLEHQVQKGDNLWKIAEYYYKSGYNWVDIAKANSLDNPDGLAIGQKLTIPNVEAKTITVKELPKTGVSQEKIENPIEGGSYTIQKGDSLWTIAIRAYGDGYQWVKISKENNIKNPDIIHVGNELSIPR